MMIAQDFKVFDNDGDGEMNFLLLFYDTGKIRAKTDHLSMRYGASITLHKGMQYIMNKK